MNKTDCKDHVKRGTWKKTYCYMCRHASLKERDKHCMRMWNEGPFKIPVKGKEGKS